MVKNSKQKAHDAAYFAMFDRGIDTQLQEGLTGLQLLFIFFVICGVGFLVYMAFKAILGMIF